MNSEEGKSFAAVLLHGGITKNGLPDVTLIGTLSNNAHASGAPRGGQDAALRFGSI